MPTDVEIADEEEPTEDPALQRLSAGELLKEIGFTATALVRTELELARAELRSDLRQELAMFTGLAVAASAGTVALSLVFVSATFALANHMPAWLAALAMAGVALLIALIAGALGWKKRVRTPLERTRRSLEENAEWTKERLA